MNSGDVPNDPLVAALALAVSRASTQFYRTRPAGPVKSKSDINQKKRESAKRAKARKDNRKK